MANGSPTINTFKLTLVNSVVAVFESTTGSRGLLLLGRSTLGASSGF